MEAFSCETNRRFNSCLQNDLKMAHRFVLGYNLNTNPNKQSQLNHCNTLKHGCYISAILRQVTYKRLLYNYITKKAARRQLSQNPVGSFSLLGVARTLEFQCVLGLDPQPQLVEELLQPVAALPVDGEQLAALSAALHDPSSG